MAEDVIQWRPGTIFILKVLALVVPWGVISAAADRHENIGYSVGLLVGILCLNLVPPREKTLWRWFGLWLVMTLLHPILKAVVPKLW
jgi:multisubunit Na+/H+ antiporter MnhE subunit